MRENTSPSAGLASTTTWPWASGAPSSKPRAIAGAYVQTVAATLADAQEGVDLAQHVHLRGEQLLVAQRQQRL